MKKLVNMHMHTFSDEFCEKHQQRLCSAVDSTYLKKKLIRIVLKKEKQNKLFYQ